MAIPAWQGITDTQIEAYRPVTASLVRRLRNNLEATRRAGFRNVFGTVGGNAAVVGSWTVVGSMTLAVDLSYRGGGGTDLALYITTTVGSPNVSSCRLNAHYGISSLTSQNTIDYASEGGVKSDWLVVPQGFGTTERVVRIDIEGNPTTVGGSIICQWLLDAPGYIRLDAA